MSTDKEKPGRVPGRDQTQPLPKRVYGVVATEAGAKGVGIMLDGKRARTPKSRELVLPTQALADAVAAEWDAQGERIDHASMPLTRLANTVLDGISGREADVSADIVRYAGSDLICYRADGPDELISRQAAHWDPVLVWARAELGATFVRAAGVMPVSQPSAALERVRDAVAGLDPFRLAALHVMTTLMGSALLAIAVLEGRLTPEAAWAAAHVDEDWQISQWGEDAEAAARRRRRWAEMQAACRLLSLVSGA